MTDMHPDDHFHTPRDGNPDFTETAWWALAVPERKLSMQFYPFFRTNQKVIACGVYVWDDTGADPSTALYAKAFWHLPFPEQPLTDIKLANNFSILCLEPLSRYRLGYEDPDGADEISADLTFTADTPPHYLGRSHFDQPGRFEGHITLHGERIAVDYHGFRDRKWQNRSQFGTAMVKGGAARGGYTYGSASAGDGFHIVTWDKDGTYSALYGHYRRGGVSAKLAHGTRSVVERDPATGYASVVRLAAVDELGRELRAEGRCINRHAWFINPNMFTVDSLTAWDIDGMTFWGEDHDNYTHSAARSFFRGFHGHGKG